MRMKEICKYWLDRLMAGETALDHKKLQSDRGFMVYVTQPYPVLKPYLKGFHLSLETWRGGRDAEGWKLPPKQNVGKLRDLEYEREWLEEQDPDGVELEAVIEQTTGPVSGLTMAVPRSGLEIGRPISIG